MTVRRYIEKTLEAIREPEVLRRIYIITILMALFILAITIRGPDKVGTYITDENGKITGISRYSTETSETYEMILEVKKGNNVTEREVTLELKPYSTGRNSAGVVDSEEQQKAELESQIDGMITALEYTPGDMVHLPTKLEDGTTLRWQDVSKQSNPAIALIPIVYILLLALTIKSRLDVDINREAVIRREILHDLPRFCNQLFLMMNAGMILSDAFEKICTSYMDIKEVEQSWFQKEMINVYMQNCDHHTGAAAALSEFASEYNVKELTRIAAILAVNEKRGSDVVDNLSSESRYLWDDRKLVAREGGKAIDMKMSYPLGALLILLIIITMAPAMLNI